MTALAAGTPLYRGARRKVGVRRHNPGDARFSPFDDTGDGHRVPSIYLAETPLAALLGRVFHEVHQGSSRIIYERDLRGKLMAHPTIPRAARLDDLRAAELIRHHLSRDQVVAGPAEEVLVLFGDSFPSGRGAWPLTGPGIRTA